MENEMIPQFDLTLTEEDHQAVGQCLISNWVSSAGPTIAEFEGLIAKTFAVKAAAATASGTAALHLAVKAAGIQSGDFVLVPATTFVASVNVLNYVGATPIFVDVNCDHANLCENDLAQALEDCKKKNIKPKALIMVHALGHTGNLAQIATVCRDQGLILIEDAAQCLGAQYQNKPLGSFGAIAATSFNGNKMVTCGGGGAVFSSQPEWIERCRHWAQQSRVKGGEYIHDDVGYNYRLPNLNAALGLSQLQRLHRILVQKEKIFAGYRQRLANLKRDVCLIEGPKESQSNHWLPVVKFKDVSRMKDLEQIKDALAFAKVAVGKFYFPMHLQKPFQNSALLRPCANAQWLYEHCLILPYGLNVSAVKQDLIITQIQRALHAQ